MSTRHEQHERRHEAAYTSTAERVRRGVKKSKGRNSGLAGPSEAGPSDAIQRGIEQTPFPASVQVVPLTPFRTRSQSQIPITPPQSSTDNITKDDGDNILEEKVQDQQQLTVGHGFTKILSPQKHAEFVRQLNPVDVSDLIQES